MDETIDRAIAILAGKIVPAATPEQAMKFTQAALNLAHVKSVLFGIKEARKPKGAGS